MFAEKLQDKSNKMIRYGGFICEGLGGLLGNFWVGRGCVVRFTEICNKNGGLYFGVRDFCSKYGGLRRLGFGDSFPNRRYEMKHGPPPPLPPRHPSTISQRPLPLRARRPASFKRNSPA